MVKPCQRTVSLRVCSVLLEYQETGDGNNIIKLELTTSLSKLHVIGQKTMPAGLTKGNKCKLTVKGSNFYPLCKGSIALRILKIKPLKHSGTFMCHML
jgi:hypothetical protein